MTNKETISLVPISGAGIRVVSRYAVEGIAGNEQAFYSLAFRQMNEYYHTLTGLDYGEKCKNCTRLSGLAHEPQVYHNPQAVPFEVSCMEVELIQAYYRRPLEGEEAIFVTNFQILQRINAGLRQKLSPVKIGIVMKRLGYELVRVAGKRGYRVVELKGEEIYRNQKAMARYC